MKLTIEERNNYGAPAYYPVCDTAKTFSDIIGTKTLTPAALMRIKKLGYTITLTNNVPSFLKENNV
jgi:hypothetical protein